MPMMETIHRMLKTGDIESLIFIENSLLQSVTNLIKETSNQKHHYFVQIWSQWAKNNAEPTNEGLRMMGDIIGTDRASNIEAEVKLMEESYEAMRDKNNEKLKHIKFSKANTEVLHQILSPKSVKNTQQLINTSTEIQLPQEFSPTTSYLTSTPKSKLSSSSGSNLKINMSSFSSSSEQRIREPIKLSGRKFIRKSSFSSSKPAESEREISVGGEENSKTPGLRPDYFTVHPNNFNNLAKDSGSSSHNTHKKKQILKPKTLLYKNSALEIGLLCSILQSSSQTQLECHILYTPFTFLTNINFKVICPSWLYLYSIEGDMKMESFPETQYCMKVVFECKIGRNMEDYANKTWIEISYGQGDNSMGKNIEKVKLEMPIMINKFYENIDIDANDLKIVQKGSEYSGFIRLNKICRTFDNFLKYFPKSIVFNDPKVFLARLSAFNNQFYLYFKVVSKNEAIIKLIPTNKKENSATQMHQTILNTFLFLFGI